MITTHEYQARRARLLAKLPPNSVAVVPAFSEVTRSNDTHYSFRQNSDFFYLTGFEEPDAWLVLCNAKATAKSMIFVRPTDSFAEIWHGRRLGVMKAAQTLCVDSAYSIDELSQLLPEILNGHQYLYYSLGANLKADEIVNNALATCKASPKQSLEGPSSICDVNEIIHAMRLIKSGAEIETMQKSADISCAAHKACMQMCEPGVWEYQLEAKLLYCFAMNGARHAAYASIVGGGDNACILHYTENKDLLQDGDLVLIDAGSEYSGYAADITRTFPVNGKFSEPQKELYNIVLRAQIASIEAFRPGVTIPEVSKIAIEIITKGLIDLHILPNDFDQCIESMAYREFFMHGLGHYLGLDVHDVGKYKTNGEDLPMETGMVLTVEPGIYISESANVPEQYKGIGIRIEDNIVITQTGNRVLTNKVPKSIEDIEVLMQKSPSAGWTEVN